jgi:NAD-dependent deacetylase
VTVNVSVARPNGLSASDRRQIAELIPLVRRARRLFFVTGAGLSAESGLPTYRGVGGLYNGGPGEGGLAIEELLSGEMMASRPEVTWKYLLQIEEATRGARPSRAHQLIAAAAAERERVLVLTQNVDSLHRLAGSREVIDIHGDCRDLYCTRCGDRRRVESYHGLGLPPRCARCGGDIRPDVVLFGEMLPMAKVRALQAELEAGYDVYFSVGTTSVFPYIQAPMLMAARAGLPTVEINPGETEISELMRFRLRCTAGQALEALLGDAP